MNEYGIVDSVDLAGRRLSWYEVGDPDGIPVIYTPGTPETGIVGAIYHESAAIAGVRWISVDKPGYGLSGNDPTRTLLSWARDILSIANQLELGTFAVAGESGGGPHALALAHEIPERITCCLVIAGAGPGASEDEGLKPTNRKLYDAILNDPESLPRIAQMWSDEINDPQRRGAFLGSLLEETPEYDQRLWDDPRYGPILLQGTVEAFKNGPDGFIRDCVAINSPYGFNLGDISRPVVMWHGSLDTNVPVSVSQRAAAEIPGSNLRIVEGAGHMIGVDIASEVMEEARLAAFSDNRK